MATALSKFLPYVSQYVIGCPDPFTIQMLRSVIIDFCQATLIVQDVATQDVVAGQQDYDIDVPANMNIVKIMDVFYKDVQIGPSSIESISSGVALRGPIGTLLQDAGPPQTFFVKTPHAQALSLYPVPDANAAVVNGLAIRTAYSPNRLATVVEDLLFDNWAEEITAGTVARLMKVPNQTFSNPNGAGEYAARYNAALRDAGIYARTGQVTVASRVKPVMFP